MKDILNKDINELAQHLLVIQNKVIGLFKPRFYPAGQYIPVVENDNGQLYCIEIGGLLGLQHLHISVTAGHYVPFMSYVELGDSEPCSLTEMMQNPIQFNNWYKNNCTQ